VDGSQVQCKIKTSDPLPEFLVKLAEASAGGCLRSGLATLLRQLGHMLNKYPCAAWDSAEEQAKGALPWRQRCAVVCHKGELKLLLTALQIIVDRLVQVLSSSQLTQEDLAPQQSAIVELYSFFAQLPECKELQEHWVKFATAAFLGLYGRLQHACADALLKAATKAPSATTFTQRMAFWGSYLAAQFCVTGTIARSDATAMLMESTDLRNSLGWSIPTDEAISIISAAPQPIKVLGSPESAAPWADALETAGAELTDGAGSARTFVVVWPDVGGEGNAGLEGLGEDPPEVLICIGEWDGSTLGLSPSAEAKVAGQAWSMAAQKHVCSKFSLRSTSYLPSWPLACDRFAVYGRSPN